MSEAPGADALLLRAQACHDDDAPAAARLLRALQVTELSPERRPLQAYLLNHVLGEQLGLWTEAFDRQAALLAAAGSEAQPVLLRQAAVAAGLAGATPAEAELIEALAHTTGAAPSTVHTVVRLSALSFCISGLTGAAAGDVVLQAVRPLHEPAWSSAGPLDAAAAASCNNIAASLADRPKAELQQASLRAALAECAELSQRLWLRAGDWVNHERACYLRALAASALGEPHRALAHAREGLGLLDDHDSTHEQNVDRAFLELEHAHACARLGLDGEAHTAEHRAHALVADFDDEGLKREFEERIARNRTLMRG